jgi:benzoyl-CoA 2,3-dioxygenase component A
MEQAQAAVIKQHLIDPEICIRCNTCESICPQKAITHDDNNYVVDADLCNLCMACISPCPTGSIDNWRQMPRARAYTPAEQLTWESLPPELSAEELAEAGVTADAVVDAAPAPAATTVASTAEADAPFNSAQYGAQVPPWSAAHPYTNLYGPKAAEKTITATVTGNVRVTEVGTDYDTHHVVLDFGQTPFPCLEGQSIAIIPPGTDEKGRAHHARQYSIASPRNGERPEGGRHRAGDRAVWHQLPDAQSSAQPYRDDLHRHRQRPHARHDRVAPPPARQRQVRGRTPDAVFRRAHAAGAALLRPAAKPA